MAIKDIQEAYQSQVVPPVIITSGLSLMRSLYLYEKVREYIRDPKKRDKVCPKPTPVTAINSSETPGNVPDSDQPGPSNAIPDPSAVADNTHSEMQDEGNSCVSGRRKRRSGSELILAFQCTVCGNKYASTCSSALSTHKKNSSHKQPAVNTVISLRQTLTIIPPLHTASTGATIPLTDGITRPCSTSRGAHTRRSQ